MTPKHLESQVDAVVALFRRRQIVGSYAVALKTAILLRLVVSQSRWSEASTLIEIVKDVGRKLIASQSQELAIGNVVRQILHLIREEYHATKKHTSEDASDALSDTETPPSSSPASAPNSQQDLLDDEYDSDYHRQHKYRHHYQQNTSKRANAQQPASLERSTTKVGLLTSSTYNLFGVPTAEEDYSKPSYDFKPAVMEGVNDMIEDIENCYTNISSMALEHIHTNEIIMTIGKSKTVEKFLIHAAKKRKFQVIIAETAPLYRGHELAASLAAEGIDTTLITNSAIFAVMSRVNKVILGCHAVLANGGLLSVSGTQIVAAAARAHSTPVVVCTGLYKLSPVFPYDESKQHNVLVAPDSVLSYTEGHLLDKVDVINPHFDYVPPEHVSLFITNFGGHPPSYLYRLLKENYDPQDQTLD